MKEYFNYDCNILSTLGLDHRFAQPLDRGQYRLIFRMHPHLFGGLSRNEYGAVLIYDEIPTCFRLALGGAHVLFEIFFSDSGSFWETIDSC